MNQGNQFRPIAVIDDAPEQRLRKALAYGLVRDEVMQDVKDAIEMSRQARSEADYLRAQNLSVMQRNSFLEKQAVELQRKIEADTAAYQSAVEAAEKATSKIDKIVNAAIIAGMFVAVIGASVIAQFIFRLLF